MRAVIGTVFALLLAVLPSPAQDEPFVVHDTRPVIMQGPYLSSLSETGATLVWTTDTPCHAKVVFGAPGGPLDRQAANAAHGLLPIGTLHVVRLSGLEPGRTYAYRAVATRVVKMKAYWPEKGLAAESPERAFTTFDRSKPAITFSAVTDTHETPELTKAVLGAVDWTATEFLVHLGDAFHSLESEDQLIGRWIGPAERLLAGVKLNLLVRGNHETRGVFARALFDYFPTPEGRFYYARDHGPVHFVVLDTGEDKADETNVYAELNAFRAYRDEELAWFVDHFKSDRRAAEAPFRVVLLHQPNWGWTDGGGARWAEAANRAKVDLAIGGHYHRLRIIEPGAEGNPNAFPVVALGQEQVLKVEATRTELKVTITGKDGAVLETRVVKARR